MVSLTFALLRPPTNWLVTADPVQRGKSFDYVFKMPDAGTFWYHAHNKSWVHVARGLYGPLIVDEPVPLLGRDHDITLIVDDWRLDDRGRFDLASLGDLLDWTHAGRVGNWLLHCHMLEHAAAGMSTWFDVT